MQINYAHLLQAEGNFRSFYVNLPEVTDGCLYFDLNRP